MKPSILYHGSTTPDIKTLEPRKRYTPAALGKKAKPAIYAAADPAYAVGHGFPWSSDEGFDIYEKDGTVVLMVPREMKGRLEQKIFVYALPARGFHLLKEDSPKSRIYLSHRRVKPIKAEGFDNVRKAMKYYGGKIKLI
jgi:hypothetical protein